MLRVGIHENIQFHKATRNDKGTLVVGIKQVEGSNPLASLDSSSDDSAGGQPENDFLFFGPQALTRTGELDTPENNLNKIKELKDTLTHILLGFMTQDKIKWDTLKNTGVDATNLPSKLTQQPILDVIYKNIVDQFIEMISSYLTNTNYLFRVLLIRQSKTKHYPAFRKRYLKSQPFMEPMSVPKEASVLKYSKWEIENNMNSPEKVEEGSVMDKVTANAVDEVFNS